MSNPPKITVIVAVRNMVNHLGRTLASVVAQHYDNLELIVMDGGSTDGSIDIIKEYQAHITYWQSKPDNGPANAANLAIDMATGELIGFLNADDILQPGLLNEIARIYQRCPKLRMVTCGINVITVAKNGRQSVLRSFIDTDKLQVTLKNMLFELTAFNGRYFHKDLFKTYGKFNPLDKDGKWNLSNDREFLVRLALAGVRSEIINQPLYTYLSHEGSFSFNKKNLPRIYREHLEIGKNLLIKSLSTEDLNIVQNWIARETVNLFLITLAQLNIRNAFSTAISGITNYPYKCLQQLAIRTFEISRNKLIKIKKTIHYSESI